MREAMGVPDRNPWGARDPDFWTADAGVPGMPGSLDDRGPGARGPGALDPCGSGTPDGRTHRMSPWGMELPCITLPWSLVVESRHWCPCSLRPQDPSPSLCAALPDLREPPGSHQAGSRGYEEEAGFLVRAPGVALLESPVTSSSQSPPSSSILYDSWELIFSLDSTPTLGPDLGRK